MARQSRSCSILAPSRKAFAAVAIVVALGLACAFDLAWEMAVVDRTRLGHDPIGAYQHRFEGLKPLVAREPVVGYFCGLAPAALKANPQELARYYLAQYALAPTIVANDLEHSLVVGNFGFTRVEPQWLEKFGLLPRQSLGDGLFLLVPAGK